MVLSKNSLIITLFTAYCFVISYILLGLYVKGDQLHYIRFYETISEYNFIKGFVHYNMVLGSQEPVYYVLVYIVNPIISKKFLISILNAVLGYFLSRLLLERRLHPSLLVLLALNFYLLVLFLGAERLKLGLIVLLMSFVVKNSRFSGFLKFLSILTHFQTILLLLSEQLGKVPELAKKIRFDRISYKAVGAVGVGILMVFILVALRSHLQSKLAFYIEKGGLSDAIKPLFFMILSMLYTSPNKYKEVFFMSFPLVVAAVIIGDDRVAIFSYFLFFYFASTYRRGLNLGIFLTSFYFIFKGVVFIQAVINTGSGF